MAYKWKPTKAQKDEYILKMKEKKSLNTFTTNYAIRKGCFVKYYNVNKGYVVKGIVTSESYGKNKNQHTFVIDNIMVKGRNLYPNIIEHIQGDISKKL